MEFNKYSMEFEINFCDTNTNIIFHILEISKWKFILINKFLSYIKYLIIILNSEKLFVFV